MKKSHIQNRKNTPEYLSPEQAEEIFKEITSDLHIEDIPDYALNRHHYKNKLILTRYVPKAGICFCILAVLFFVLPGTVLPATVSNVSAATFDKGQRTGTIDFQLNTIVPVQEVNASINKKALTVTKSYYNHYSVNVGENGYLILEVTSITGLKSSHNILVEGLDSDAPHIVSHHRSDNQIVIYLTDNDGSGIDYEKIDAYLPDTGERRMPSYINEAQDYVIFDFPQSAMYITISDKAGNKTIALLDIKESAE